MKEKELGLRNKKEIMTQRRTTILPTVVFLVVLLVMCAFVSAVAGIDKFMEGLLFASIFVGGVVIASAIIFAFVYAGEYASKLANNDRFLDSGKNRKSKPKAISTPSRYKLLKISGILFSAKTQKIIFHQSMADWDEELYEALKRNKDANTLMITVRNFWAFISAMIQKSPIGDLFEFVMKIALKVAK